ncbi:MAG: multicopper oxidase domain-containing protein [Kineosporiaceae bacterium]
MSGPRARWHRRAGTVVLAWALALAAAVLAHPFLPQPRWTLVHLLTLGVLGNAVLVWSWHFATALLRLPAASVRRGEVARLVAYNATAVVLVAGMLSGVRALVAVAGAGLVAVVAAHAVALAHAVRRALPGRFAVTLRYLVAAALLLCVGGAGGVVLGSGGLEHRAGTLPERVLVAHVTLAGSGWLALTVVGTLLTLWPTMVRARIPDTVQRHARLLLPALVVAVLAASAAVLTGGLLVAALGPLVVLGLLAALALPYRHTLRLKGGDVPVAPSAVPVLAGLGWLAATQLAQSVALATAPDWVRAADAVTGLTPALLVGFGAQVLVGALTYLWPVVLGGGPAAVRDSCGGMARGWAARAVLLDAGLLGCLLPVSPPARVILSTLVAASLACTPLLALRVALARRSPPPPEPRDVPAPHPFGQAVAGLVAVVLAVAGGVGVDPAAAGLRTGADAAPSAGGAAVTGRTTRLVVHVQGMRFVPDVLRVPAGDRLVLTLVNDGEDRHDLVLETGARTPRLVPGGRADLDAGPITGRVRGWCSLPGHRMRGMTLTVEPIGAPEPGAVAAPEPSAASPGHHHPDDADVPIPDADVARALAAPPAASSAVADARLAPAGPGSLHRITLPVTQTRVEVAPGIVQARWTFGGTAPGPVLHGRVGDTFEITLRNDASIGHSIDFHAGALAPDGPMRTIQPGESLVYRFRADQAGIWMYHCSTMPMSLHLANGMIGAVVIDPPGLAPVAREYVLVQSELYLGAPGDGADDDALRAERPDLVVFNGRARQYDAHPLPVGVGERVRVWVLDAGPQRSSAFHVVGTRFDTVWTEGAYRLRPGAGPGAGGAQVLPLLPAQGGFVEFTLPEAGHYPFVTHAMVDAERGAHGLFLAR